MFISLTETMKRQLYFLSVVFLFAGIVLLILSRQNHSIVVLSPALEEISQTYTDHALCICATNDTCVEAKQWDCASEQIHVPYKTLEVWVMDCFYPLNTTWRIYLGSGIGRDCSYNETQVCLFWANQQMKIHGRAVFYETADPLNHNFSPEAVQRKTIIESVHYNVGALSTGIISVLCCLILWICLCYPFRKRHSATPEFDYHSVQDTGTDNASFVAV